MRHAISALASLALAGLVLAAGPALAEPADGRLKLIRDSATLRIGYRTDSRPFSYLDEQGRPTGYTIELCRRIAKSLEQQLNGPVAIQWVAVDTRTRFDAIVNGSADMECGSTTMSLSRMKIVDFSSVVFAESTGVLAKSGGGVFSFDSMAGKTIGVIAGTTNARAVRDQIARRKLAITTVEFADRQEGVAALARGELDGFASDKLTLLAAARAANLRDFGLLSEDCRSSRSPSCCRAATGRSGWRSTPRCRTCFAAARSSSFTPAISATSARAPRAGPAWSSSSAACRSEDRPHGASASAAPRR